MLFGIGTVNSEVVFRVLKSFTSIHAFERVLSEKLILTIFLSVEPMHCVRSLTTFISNRLSLSRKEKMADSWVGLWSLQPLRFFG